MDQELIQIYTMATRAACIEMTAARLGALRDSVEHASCLAGQSGWDRSAAAHAEIFALLAGMTGDPVLSAVAPGSPDALYRVVGPAAQGMIVGSRQRLLACMRMRDADGAALEMERHLRTLAFMRRLALPVRRPAPCEVRVSAGPSRPVMERTQS